jgi:hypothetical protein
MAEFEEPLFEMEFVDDLDEAYDRREREQAEELAARAPGFDYYSAQRPQKPKLEIGQYVADQGFRVPLTADQADWEKAFDDGTAMLRSEMPQDYDGLSGLLPSERLADSIYNWDADGYQHELGSVIMKGLRSGELDPEYYMSHLRGRYMTWEFYEADLLKTAVRFGGLKYLDIYSTGVSQWRYVEGTNVSVFADPHVEGRYYFGVIPYSPEDEAGYSRYQPIGGYKFDAGEYDTPLQFRKHDVPFVARPFVEYYEAVRALPRFDNTQCPVLELQQDPEGNIHFLQYLKTGQQQRLTEPFDLPSSDNTLRTYNVRGITQPAGQDMRMFVAPNLLTPGMEGQAIFCSLLKPRGIETQFASKAAGFILHEAYIDFQNNHFDSSPLYRPPLAASLSDCQHSPEPVFEKVDAMVNKALHGSVPPFSRKYVPYIDIHVTSNGHEAAIESNWQVKTIAYDDVK